MNDAIEFMKYFCRRLIDWASHSERARELGWDPDYSQVRFLEHVDRKTIELLVLGIVFIPLMGYLYSWFVPFIMDFWRGMLGA